MQAAGEFMLQKKGEKYRIVFSGESINKIAMQVSLQSFVMRMWEIV